MEPCLRNLNRFLLDCRRRLNHHLWLALCIRCLAGGGVVLLVIALSYVLRGHHVPPLWYPLVLVGALAVGSGLWALMRHSVAEAARRADRHFNLKDSLRSYYGFHHAGREEGFYGLQAQQTEAQLARVSLRDIRFAWPKRTFGVGLVLLLSSGMLGLKADSPVVLAQAQLAEQTLIDSEEINKTLKDLVERMTREAASEDIERLMQLDELQQRVAELETTPNLKEALRQYALLEKRLNSISARLHQRQEEQLLGRMGRELQKEGRAKALGKRLVDRDYKEAATELNAFKMDPQATLKEQREQLDRLQAMSGRMSSEAQRSAAGRRPGQSDPSVGSAGASGRSGSERGESSEAGSLAQSLNQSVRAYDKALSEAERQARQGAESDGEAGQANSEAANEELAKLGQYLNKMGAKRQAQSAIEQLCRSLSQSQGRLGGKAGDLPGNTPEAGGLEAGQGSSDSVNNQASADTPAGYQTQLKGIKGRGPSTKTTETAGDGAGSASAVTGRVRQTFQRQTESFVRREDVPQAMKAGVKAYFENIHQTGEDGKHVDE